MLDGRAYIRWQVKTKQPIQSEKQRVHCTALTIQGVRQTATATADGHKVYTPRKREKEYT